VTVRCNSDHLFGCESALTKSNAERDLQSAARPPVGALLSHQMGRGSDMSETTVASSEPLPHSRRKQNQPPRSRRQRLHSQMDLLKRSLCSILGCQYNTPSQNNRRPWTMGCQPVCARSFTLRYCVASGTLSLCHISTHSPCMGRVWTRGSPGAELQIKYQKRLSHPIHTGLSLLEACLRY